MSYLPKINGGSGTIVKSLSVLILLLTLCEGSRSLKEGVSRNAYSRFRRTGSGRLLPSPKVYRCGDIGKEMVVNFVNQQYPDDDTSTGDCSFRLVVQSHDVCQIRVDLVDTELMDPSRGECLSQSFTVEGSIWPTGLPPLCGINNDQHFYLHLEPWTANVSIVDFKVVTVIGRSYRFGIWLTQIDCAASNVLRAPAGCTQYFLSEEGSIKSFNYEGYRYLNGQNYQICIRPGKGVCGIRYTSAPGDFGVKKSTQGPQDTQGRSGAGTSVCGTDYIMIPEGRDTIWSIREGRLLFSRRRPQTIVRTSPVAARKKLEISLSQDRFCGGNLSPTGGETINKPVFARVRSNLITIRFKTSPLQEFKGKTEALNLTSGFQINYAQLRNCEDNETDMVGQPHGTNLTQALQLQLTKGPGVMGTTGLGKDGLGTISNVDSGPIDRGDIGDDDTIWEYLDPEEDEDETDIYDYL